MAAATSRCGSSGLLWRAMAASTRSAALPLPARAFSTSLPSQLRSSSPRHGDWTPGTQKPRSNPLVGRFAPVLPQRPSEEPPPVSTQDSALSSRPTPPVGTAESSAGVPPNAHMPPPPPPPPLSASPSDSADSTSSSTQPSHPYTAADASTPLEVDIGDIIATKSMEFGEGLGVNDPMSRPTIRAKAVAGRTVFIKDRLTANSAPTPTVALRVLDRLSRDQRIKQKCFSQKFHERKGLRRKRLKSQRWRARFKTGFRAAVSRVIELKRQGW